MSVIKYRRGLSEMEFYKNALRLQTKTTQWYMSDFGTTKSIKRMRTVLPELSEEDEETITCILKKNGISSSSPFKTTINPRFLDSEWDVLSNHLRNLISNLTHANSIYPTTQQELDRRRDYQNKAIGDCYSISQEFQYIASVISIDLNKIKPLLDLLDSEISLIKGWRKSDSKFKKKFG